MVAAETRKRGMAGEAVLEMSGILKRFPGVHALKDVSFRVRRGEVHALVGENGAGKSTLMKVLSGAYTADEGQIQVNGQVIDHPTPGRMLELGIAVIYQEFAQAPHLTVAENIFLGCLPRTPIGIVDWRQARRASEIVMERLGFYVDPDTRIDMLSIAQRQMVEIARAISRDAGLIVLDEPSAVLGDTELVKLFEMIRRLAAEQDVSFIYISHRIKEVFEISQTVTVLRDGAVIGSCPTETIDTDALIRMMVGRKVTDIFPKRAATAGKALLRVKGLSRKGVLHDIDLELRAGEIVGICGLAGAGRTELLRAIVGADPIDAGEVEAFGNQVAITSPRKAIAMGLGLLPEDRKTEGLFLDQAVSFNVTIAGLGKFVSGGFLNIVKERGVVRDYARRLGVKTPDIDTRVQNLSGGNQQKCVLAKQLNADCRVLLVDEPTRGVDVGAKREIYDLLVELAERQDAAVLMVSSELPEILGMSDRILVMRDGRIAAELSRSEATEEKIMTHAAVH